MTTGYFGACWRKDGTTRARGAASVTGDTQDGSGMKRITASSRKQQIRQALVIAANRTGHAVSCLAFGEAKGTFVVTGPDVMLYCDGLFGCYLQFRDWQSASYQGQALPTIDAIELLIWERIRKARNRAWTEAVGA